MVHATLSLTGILVVLTAVPIFGQDADTRGDVRFRGLDKNGDGKVTREEFPERLKRIFDRIDADGDGSLTLEEDRVYRASRGNRDRNRGRATPKLPGNVKLIADLDYAGDDNPRQKLDLFLPEKRESDRPLPLVVWIHGGAWRSGDKRSGHQRIASFVETGKYAGASIAYRLSGEKIWPAQIHDCKAAIRWLRANAEKYNLDADRIAVWGSSAGGHLVAMLAVAGNAGELEGKVGEHLDASSAVTCAVDYFGPTEFTEMNKFPSKMDHDAADSPESRLVGGAIQENEKVSHAASPLKYISGGDAPILIAHGSEDPLVPYNQSEIFHAALKKAKLDSTFIKVIGGGHGFRSKELDRRVRLFLEKHLLGKKDVTISSEPVKDERRARPK